MHSNIVFLRMMVKSNCDLDQPLQEYLGFPVLLQPNGFDHLVAFEEPPGIEQLDPLYILILGPLRQRECSRAIEVYIRL